MRKEGGACQEELRRRVTYHLIDEANVVEAARVRRATAVGSIPRVVLALRCRYGEAICVSRLGELVQLMRSGTSIAMDQYEKWEDLTSSTCRGWAKIVLPANDLKQDAANAASQHYYFFVDDWSVTSLKFHKDGC